MAKPKCEICNDKRAKRKCLVFNGQFICPSCCADLRNEACEGCRHYQTAVRFEASKTEAKVKKKFMIEINEEVEDAVDAAMVLVEKRKFKKARSILRALEKLHPGNHMILYGFGTAYAFEGRLEEGIEYLEKAIEIFPYFVHAYYNLGTAYEKKYDLRKSVDCMQKVIEIGSDDELVQKARDSIRFLEKAVMESSKISLSEFLKAQELFDAAFLLMEKSRWELAISGFRQCIETNLEHAQSYGNMGICYAQLGEKSKALAALDEALKIDPEYEPAIANKIHVERMQNGEPMTIRKMKSIEYYREYPHKKKSYLQSLLDENTE